MFKIFFHIFFIFFYIFKRFDLNLIHWYKSEIVIRNIRGCISMVPWNLFIYNTDRETRFDTRDIFLFASENHIFFQIRKIYFFTVYSKTKPLSFSLLEIISFLSNIVFYIEKWTIKGVKESADSIVYRVENFMNIWIKRDFV